MGDVAEGMFPAANSSVLRACSDRVGGLRTGMKTISTEVKKCRLLAVVQVLTLLPLPVLWLFHRLPDSKEVFHITWQPWWMLLPLGAGFARFVIRDKAKQEERELAEKGLVEKMASKVMLAVFVPFFLLWSANAVLGLMDYERKLTPIVYKSPEIGEKGSQERALSHPVLLFTFNPGTMYNKVRINKMGYREREIDPEKTPNMKRVICFGDSITAQGRPNYSYLLNEHLQSNPPDDHDWQAFNMGVYGYSSRQGLAVFRLQGKALKPDFITVYFGPNDRNLYAQTDKQRMAKVQGGLKGKVLQKIQDKPLGQLIIGTATDVAMAKSKKQNAVEEKMPRVPPEDYRHVMRSFVLEAREIGAEAILLTAPRRELSLGLVAEGHAKSLEAITRRHDAYNDIVREVAAELNAPLVDLAKEMEGEAFDHMFAEDGIHFDSYATEHVSKPESQPGLEWIAARLHREISELVK
jgi:lysophospholipase L1-like esterase